MRFILHFVSDIPKIVTAGNEIIKHIKTRRVAAGVEDVVLELSKSLIDLH